MPEREALETRVRSVMEDPSAQALAGVYAEAFLGAAAEAGVEEALEELASFLDDVVARNPEFQQVLLSDLVGRDDKIKLIDRVIAPYASELFTSFLRVLAQHDRMSLLPLILKESRLKHERATGRRRVQVRSARPLPETAVEQIRARLAEQFSFEPLLETREDPELLGGLVIQIGDTVYDASLRAKMQQLRDRLKQRSFHEIQSGRDRFSHPEGD